MLLLQNEQARMPSRCNFQASPEFSHDKASLLALDVCARYNTITSRAMPVYIVNNWRIMAKVFKH